VAVGDILTGHLPPHNIEAEQACLGSCLIDPEAFDRVAEVLSGPEDFYREAHQDIFEAMRALDERNQNIDLITLSNELRNRQKLDSCGGVAYLDSLVNQVGSSAHVSAYARIVAERAIERRLQQAGNAISRLALEGDIEVSHKVDQAEAIVLAVGDKRSRQELEHFRPALEATFDTLYERFKNRMSVTGVATGFHAFDELTGGLQPSNLIIVAARPAMGKTAFCLSIAVNVALNRERPGTVAVFSLEMSRSELCQRILCSVAQVNAAEVRRGHLRDNEWQRIARAMNQLAEAPIYMDDTPSITVMEIKAKARRLQRRHGLDLVIIDYLQLIRGSGRIENRVQEIAEISRQLKGMAKELNVPVVALSQVGRAVESRQDKRPNLSDLRESGSLEQDSDLVAFIYRDEYYNPHTQEPNVAEVIVAKQRNGPVDSVKLSFVKRYAAFFNLEQERTDYDYAPVEDTDFGEVPL
jgi:replicative DNA helicase